jgi:D-glycero-D-manno-heptose 1,7-bisphosphate phosphatase
MTRAAVFVDKDGTLIENVPYNVDPALLAFTRGAVEALQRLARAGYALFVVTNQPGVALGLFDRAALDRLLQALRTLLNERGVELAGLYACTHRPPSHGLAPCTCRKPAPGMLQRAADEHDIDLGRSWMVGDILDDVEAGRRAGCRTVMLDVGHETEWRLSDQRLPHFGVADLAEAADVILSEDGGGAPIQPVKAVHDEC